MNSDGNENEMTVANNYVTAEQIADHRWSPITELPAIFFAKVGAAVMLNRKRLCRFPFLLDNNTMAYSLSPTKWDADFAKALFGTVDLTSLVQVGALPSYNAGDVESMEIYLPSLLEQEQIGAYFKHLDHLITLHQRECISFTARAGRRILTANKKRNTSSWEQRKLGELVDRVVRKNTNNESTLPLTISAQYGLVDQITYFNNRVASRDVSNYYLVLNGEFAYNKSTSDGYPFGAVKRLDLYEKGVLSTLYIVFAPKKEQQIDSDYLTVFFDTDRWHKGVAERAAEGARNHGLLNISAEDFFDIDLSVPKDIVEQKQIGAFIRQLDNLITLHQRKFEKLTNVKKSMLEKMFPQNGSSYPEIRFKGFTDPWEQRKFSDVVATRRGLTYKPSDIRKNGVRVLRSSNIAEDSFVLSDEDVFVVREAVNIDCVRANDILITAANGSSRLVGKHTIISGIPEESAVHGGFMLLGTTKEPHFVNASMGSSWYRRFIELFVAGGNGAIGNLNKNDLDNQDIAIPSEKEQKKIGSFFRQLDNLITLHQRELEKLQNIKKSMLEKMFV